MIKINQAVVVEGKYDKIKLSSIIDAPIIVTNGFGIFKDKDKISYIKRVAKTKGIIILTDSDNAGFMIRKRILQAVDKDDEVINVYIPDIKGKEKRKSHLSAEGNLGVEGIDVEIIKDAFKKYGVFCEKTNHEINGKEVTKTDLYFYGLTGNKNSSEKRKRFLKHNDLPENMTTNSMLDAINILFSYNEFIKICEKIYEKE